MKIQQSAENYLETIYMLSQKSGSVRSIDIANELGFSKPSVSVAMKSLRENGYIDVMGDGNIILLDPGKEIAENLGLSPSEIMMVGNDTSDDMSAEKIGMKVFLLTKCLINRIELDISSFPNGEIKDLIKILA